MSVGSLLLVLTLGLMGEEGPRVELGGTAGTGGQWITSEPWAGSSLPVPPDQCPCPPQGAVAWFSERVKTSTRQTQKHWNAI